MILSEIAAHRAQRPDVLIVEHRLGFVMANAGVDQSNVGPQDGVERALLLPRDPDASARALRAALAALSARDIGVVINDSFGRAWRHGTVGVAIGAAGLPALVDLRGAARPARRHAAGSTEIGVRRRDRRGGLAADGPGRRGPAGRAGARPRLARAGQRRPRALLRPASEDLFR